MINSIRQNPANQITVLRILLSIAMLFTELFTCSFYILYFLAGLTDILDGTMARKLGIESDFGSKLDTIADIVLVVIAAIKILPHLEIASIIWIWIGIIAIIKFVNIARVIIKRKKFLSVHSILNKVTGLLLFIFPLTLNIIDIRYSSVSICIVATLAALQEGKYVANNN